MPTHKIGYIALCLIIILIPYSGSSSLIDYLDLQSQWTSTCSSGSLQSPIELPVNRANLLTDSTTYLYKTYYNNLTSPLIEFDPTTGSFGVFNQKLGYVMFKIAGAAYKYNANNILLHTPTEHSVGAEKAALEIQVTHSLDASQISSGMEENLIISLLFVLRGKHTSSILRTFQNFRNGATDSTDLSSPKSFSTDVDGDTLENGTLGESDPTDDSGSEEISKRKLSISLEDNQVDTSSNYNILDLNNVIRTSRAYYFYKGSLTSPPCTQNVIWLIQNYYNYISLFQFQILENLIGQKYVNSFNSREIQPTNDRQIYLLYNNTFKINIIYNSSDSYKLPIALSFLLIIFLII